ncbi:MAG: hypothetical protein HDR22_03370 [Lachnospiraceae bacterium]|nr:hypothetical protein [Lachnospiraceae bacterium]
MVKRIIWLLCILLLLGLCSCSSEKEDVALKSKGEIMQYANEKYGKAVYVSEENGTDKITYTLQDKKYKFNYECTSFLTQFGLDGTYTDLYYETTTSTFDKEYCKFILDTLNLDNLYQNYPSGGKSKNPFIVAVIFEDDKLARESIPEIAKMCEKIDSRGYFSDYHIAVYDNSKEYLGIYKLSEDKYIDKYEEKAALLIYEFAWEVNGDRENLDGITYLSYKTIQYKDVEGLQLEWLNRDDVLGEDWTTAYYFDYKGKTYFMLDDKVFISDENNLPRNIYDDYYTNFWFEE